MGGMRGGGIASNVPMFVRFVCVWTAALGAVIGVIVGLTLKAPLGGMVVPMPWSGWAVCGVGIVLTLGALVVPLFACALIVPHGRCAPVV
eukprot:914983-Ditylum_brightwellii.AAC.1